MIYIHIASYKLNWIRHTGTVLFLQTFERRLESSGIEDKYTQWFPCFGRYLLFWSVTAMYGWFLLCNVAAPKNSKAAGRSFFDIVELIDFLNDLCNFGMFDGCPFWLWNMWPLLLFYQLLVLLLLFYFKCCLLMFHLFRTQYNHAVYYIPNESGVSMICDISVHYM